MATLKTGKQPAGRRTPPSIIVRVIPVQAGETEREAMDRAWAMLLAGMVVDGTPDRTEGNPA